MSTNYEAAEMQLTGYLGESMRPGQKAEFVFCNKRCLDSARHDRKTLQCAARLSRFRVTLRGDEYGDRRSFARSCNRSVDSLLSMAIACSFVWIFWKIYRCRQS